MKFSKRLSEDLQEPGWEEHYVRYRLLKKVIKVLSLLGKDADQRKIEEALSLFPPRKKGKLLRGLTKSMQEDCTICRRWRVFAEVIKDDVKHLQSFIDSTATALQRSYYTRISPDVTKLLEAHKTDRMAHKEPTLYAGSREVEVLAKFAVFMDTLAVLRRFFIVNNRALEKIVKKFRKRVMGSVDIESTSCGETCARKILQVNTFSEREDEDFESSDEEAEAPEYTVSPQHGTLDHQGPHEHQAAHDTIHLQVEEFLVLFQKLEVTCAEQWATIVKLEGAADLLDAKIMIDCSVFHDFLTDHKMQLHHQRQFDKLARVEAQSKMSTRLTRHIDMENQVRPSSFLLIGVILPLVTLAVTYTISAGIYVDDEQRLTVFDEKGYFISASIDRAPASNIGTLGLTTTLSMLSVIIFVKHKLVKKQLRGRNWMRTHRIATAFGLLSTFCGNGVAAFQHVAHAEAHNTFAALFFVCGMIHVVLETIIDVRFSLSMPFTRKSRVFFAVACVVCVLGFLLPMTYVVTHQVSHEVARPYKAVAASFEVGAFVCFVVWFASYYSILKASQFKLHVQYRVRFDSSEDLSILRFSRHHSRQESFDSISSMGFGDDDDDQGAGSGGNLPREEEDSERLPADVDPALGFDLDDIAFRESMLTSDKKND